MRGRSHPPNVCMVEETRWGVFVFGGYFYNYQCSMSSHLLSWALNIRWPFSTHTSSICTVLVYWYMCGICTSTLWAPNTRWGLWCVVGT